jgi:hypothetical protein
MLPAFICGVLAGPGIIFTLLAVYVALTGAKIGEDDKKWRS